MSENIRESIVFDNRMPNSARSDNSERASRRTATTTSEFSMRMDSLRREVARQAADDAGQTSPTDASAVQIHLHDLTSTVERLSHRLDNFIETTSQRPSVIGSKHGSRQHLDEFYGTLQKANTMSSAASTKYLIRRLKESGDLPLIDYSRDENEARGNWGSRYEFFLAALGSVVGVGNVIRFPFKCYQYGGGAFLVPYTIMFLLLGVPLFFLEASLGQFSSSGVLSCWRFAPMFEGIGWSMLLVSALTAIYYNVIVAYAIYYFAASFSAFPGLPWRDCKSKWATKYCYDDVPVINCTTVDSYIRLDDGRCLLSRDDNSTYLAGVWDAQLAHDDANIERTFPSMDYFNERFLDRSDGIDDLGGVQWRVAVSLLGVWTIVCLCMIKGIRSYGKVVYVTTLLPYVLLFILLVRAVVLDHHYSGVEEYMSADWHKLRDARVWFEAAWEVLFSFFTGFGGIITLASYNRFHYNILKDSFLVTLASCVTSFVAGFIVFAFLGYITHERQIAFSDVTDPDIGFAFITLPEVFTHLRISPIWSMIFYLMLICLGLGTQFAFVETIATGLMDRFHKWFARRHKSFIYFSTCVCLFLLGLIPCTKGGVYVLKWMEFFCGNWAVMAIGIWECVAVVWVYGWRNISKDIETMLGWTTSMWWWTAWNLATPALLAYMWLHAWVRYEAPQYNDYDWPLYSEVLGFALTALIVLPITVVPVVCFITASGSFFKRWHTMTTPTRDWGPALVRHRQLVTYRPGVVVDLYDDGLSKATTTLSRTTSPFAMDSARRSARFSSLEEDNVAFQGLDSKLTGKS